MSSLANPDHSASATVWPELPLDAWQDTYETMHRWMQIAGKIRLAFTPMCNHWWQVTLYVTARGFTTSSIPYRMRTFQLDFDFLDHEFRIETEDGAERSLSLPGMSVASFYQAVMAALHDLKIDATIWPVPVEIARDDNRRCAQNRGRICR